jgi:hypothetical protein
MRGFCIRSEYLEEKREKRKRKTNKMRCCIEIRSKREQGRKENITKKKRMIVVFKHHVKDREYIRKEKENGMSGFCIKKAHQEREQENRGKNRVFVCQKRLSKRHNLWRCMELVTYTIP